MKHMLEIVVCCHQSKPMQELFMKDFFQILKVIIIDFGFFSCLCSMLSSLFPYFQCTFYECNQLSKIKCFLLFFYITFNVGNRQNIQYFPTSVARCQYLFTRYCFWRPPNLWFTCCCKLSHLSFSHTLDLPSITMLSFRWSFTCLRMVPFNSLG